MELASVQVLVVGDDDRVILGDEPSQPDEAVGLAVGEVMRDVTRGPAAVGRGPVQLRIGDVGERIQDGERCRSDSAPVGRDGRCSCSR